MRRPLLILTICYCLGIIFADRLALQLPYLFAGAFGFLALACAWKRLLLGPSLFLAGAVLLTLTKLPLAPDDLRRILGEQAHEISIRGKIMEAPYQRFSDRDHIAVGRTLTQVDVQSIRLKDHEAWSPAVGMVLVSTRDILPENFCLGQEVEVTGAIRPPKSALAPGLFDYREYLSRLGIYYQLFASSSKDWTLLSATGLLPISERFTAWAKKTLALGLSQDDENLRLLWAMTLGWKTALTGEVSEPFMRSGTMHIFAISGMHIALIAGILVATFKMIGVRRGVCAWIVIPILWAYTWVTGWQASAIRSTIMSTVIIAGWSLRRPSDLINSLAAAALLILIWDPQQLFQASFQLSFCVVLSLALFTPVLERLRHKLLAPDPFLPAQLRPRWRRWLNWPLHFISASFVVSFAAWLGSAPLIAYYFHLFTPISLFANLVVVPLSSAALACNVASLAIGRLSPAVSELLNNSAWLWMELMVRISQWAADVKAGVFPAAMPTLSTFVLYYVVLICLVSRHVAGHPGILQASSQLAVGGGTTALPDVRTWKPGKWIWRTAAIIAAFIPWASMKLHDGSISTITILPLQGGSAVYMNLAGERWLIDCGNKEAARWTTKPFLQAEGLRSLSHFILTHGDVRHVGAAGLIEELFPPAATYISPVRFRSAPYRAVVNTLESNGVPMKILADGESVAGWQILHPAKGEKFPRADDSALVLLGEVRGKRILLLSDLGKAGQNALLNRHPDLKADVVVTGLPHAGEPVADGFLDVVQPELIIVTDSEYPASERASPALKARLSKRQSQVIYTSQSGAVTLSFSRTGLAVAKSWPVPREFPEQHAEVLARY